MGIFDIFSKRQKRLRGEVPDVYIYTELPTPLRVQIVHIWLDALGNRDQYFERYNGVYNAYKIIVDTLCREYGLFQLPQAEKYGERNYLLELTNFLLQESDIERVFDAIELSFKVIDKFTRDFDYLSRQNRSTIADNAIEELNTRFQEHAVGFQFTDGEIIRIDSELMHAEVVKPALVLLRGAMYAGAQAEFLKAHEHYRHGNTKEALTECLKSLESTIKAICEKRGWKFQSNATCNSLIQICVEKELIPTFWLQHFTSLRSTLESGVPSARNKLGGHGQGTEIIDVPMHIATYVLHMTAAGIAFLARSEEAL